MAHSDTEGGSGIVILSMEVKKSEDNAWEELVLVNLNHSMKGIGM